MVLAEPANGVLDEAPPGDGTVAPGDLGPPVQADSSEPEPGGTRIRWVSAVLALVLGLGLVVRLVDLAGAWAVLANTRLLDLLIRGGVVRLTDMDAGYIDGLPDVDLYLRSQTPIDWWVLGLALVLTCGAWLVRSTRFATIARAHDVEGRWSRVLAIGLRGETRARFVPIDIADEAVLGDLQGHGTGPGRGVRVVNAQRVVAVVEVAFYGVVALLLVGLAIWVEAMLCAALVLLVAHLLTRTPTRSARRAGRAGWWRSVGSSVQPLVREPRRILVLAATLLALPIEEVVGYLVVQSLSSEFVILGGVTPTVVLLALVAGKTATLVQVTPGGLGQFEWAFAAALYAQGQGLAEAVTITLVFAAVRYAAAATLLVGSEIVVRRARAPERLPVSEPSTNGDAHHGLVPEAHNGVSLQLLEADQGSGERLIAAPTPSAPLLLKRLFVVGSVVIGLVLIDRIRGLLVDYWLLQSLGYESVFWVDLRMKALLFVVAGAIWTAAIAWPLLVYREPGSGLRWRLAVPMVAGVVAGTSWAGSYQNFLLLRHGRSFGDADPVFGNDIGFYLFTLPALRSMVWGAALVLLASLLLAVGLLIHGRGIDGALGPRLRTCAETVARPGVIALLVGVGAFTALGIWLSRYDVLVKDNYSSSINRGAEALDVSGLYSTVNLRSAQALIVVLATAVIAVGLVRCRPAPPSWIERGPRTRFLLAVPLVLAFVAVGLVSIRDVTAVTPNEPVIQTEYIQRHIDATNRAWGMDQIEVVDADLNTFDDPLPDVEAVVGHPSISNAQLWPGGASWLERLLDPQHVERITLEADEQSPDLVLGTSLDAFRQHQKLRPYYDFLDVDVVNYQEDDGTPRLYTSAVRELPLLEPQPWLAFWGQRFVLFTHGFGLVAAPIGEVGPSGDPAYASSDVPPVATVSGLEVEDHAVYYGEGSGTIGFSNVRDLPEFDHPTEQDRADVFLPQDVDAGVRIDTPLKRLAFAWGAQEFFDPRDVADLLFSNLITNDTRIHYNRQPLDRVSKLAPFLYLDSDPYAVAADGGITWMVNGMTTSDRYPYSEIGELGDKSVRRGPFPTEVTWVNYVADSVKATVDAYTGEVTLYQISDEPVVSTWAAIYPDLFTPASEMPDDIRAQVQYPPQLLHTQFDDLWIYYHVTDPVAFFNQEDVFDDADEVLGPMLAPGKGITFSMEPYPSVIDTGAHYGSLGDQHRFATSLIFTPEGAKNLRSMVTVLHGDEDYGRISMLQFAKGSFVTGPEQAESIIDQRDEIAQQFGFWNATGVEVIRGYLTPVIVENELIYIEPVFIRSEQNALPQLARVVVVVRDQAVMAPTLEQAIREIFDLLSSDT